MNKKTIITILIITLISLLLIPIATAEQGHMTLLTVGRTDNGTAIGGTADLFLEIKEGTGRVFIDSFPLTEMDTQISTRYAQQVACDFLEKDCSNKDFFYTIRAKSNIVGGPSASGAMTVLTIALLEGLNMDEQTVMTGTINSGGIIGPVAGIEEKTKAARQKGFKKILIPKWSIIDVQEPDENLTINKTSNNNTNGTNKNITIDIVSPWNDSNNTLNITYADTYELEDVQIIPITTIEEALKEFTGKEYKTYDYELQIPPQYQDIMGKVAKKLCDRYESIKSEIPQEKLDNETIFNDTIEYINQSKIAEENQDYYSMASYCFSANTRIRTTQYEDYTNETLLRIADDIDEKSKEMLDKLDATKLRTISDLETYIIVKERLTETRDLLDVNDTELIASLGYITERFYSAIAWSTFFEYTGEGVELDETHMEQACISKISETEERLEYLELIFGEIGPYREEFEKLNDIYKKEEYEFCLFRASKLKADLNAILSTTAITEEKMPELIADKLKISKQQINKQGNKFPILGYSYYNYANSLEKTDPHLALLFTEYSVELSNLKMYFPKKQTLNITVDKYGVQQFVIGLLVGIIATLIFVAIVGSKASPKGKKPKKN